MNGRIFLPHLDRGLKPQYVVHGAFHQTHSAGDGGTDDVLSLRGKAAVSLDGKSSDALARGMECYGGHKSGVDGADLHLGVGLTVTLTLAVTLLGVVLEDADLLALAVLHDSGLHAGALHNGSAEGGLLAVDDGQDLVKLHGRAGFLVQLLDVDHVALGDLVLLAAGNDDSVHC